MKGRSFPFSLHIVCNSFKSFMLTMVGSRPGHIVRSKVGYFKHLSNKRNPYHNLDKAIDGRYPKYGAEYLLSPIPNVKYITSFSTISRVGVMRLPAAAAN